MTPPGIHALAFASRWFDPATVHRTFEPLIADWQREWCDASGSRRTSIRIKGSIAFCVATLVSAPALMRAHTPTSLLRQVSWRIGVPAGIGTLVLTWPLLRNDGPLWFRVVVMLAAIPQALILAFPFALIPAVDAIRRHDSLAPHTARAAVVKLAVTAVLFVFCVHGWLVPAANQLYRTVTFEQSLDDEARAHYLRRPPGRTLPAPGLRELSNFELIAQLAGTADGETGAYRSARATMVIREINNRMALVMLPLLLIWRRWRALDLPGRRWFSARNSILAAVAALFVFGSLYSSFRISQSIAGAWFAVALPAIAGMMRVSLVERTVARA